jgi:hypothetical protein
MAEADKIIIKLLTVSNYPTWSVRMKMLLVFKDLWEGIEPGTDVKKSELAKALSGLNVSSEYALTVEDQPDVKTAWEYFKNMFKGKSNARILQLKRICPAYGRNLGNWWPRMPHGPGMFSQN